MGVRKCHSVSEPSPMVLLSGGNRVHLTSESEGFTWHSR